MIPPVSDPGKGPNASFRGLSPRSGGPCEDEELLSLQPPQDRQPEVEPGERCRRGQPAAERERQEARDHLGHLVPGREQELLHGDVGEREEVVGAVEVVTRAVLEVRAQHCDRSAWLRCGEHSAEEGSDVFLRWEVLQQIRDEDAVEMFRGKFELEKVLLPNFTATVVARQLDKTLCSFESDCFVSQFFESLEVPSGPTAEVENSKRSLADEMLNQRVAILTDVVIFCALPKTFGILVVVM